MSSANDDKLKELVRTASYQMRKFKKATAPHLPLISKVLLILTFVEDGLRVLFELSTQVNFLSQAIGLPRALSGFLIVFSVLASFAGSAMVLTQKYARTGSYILLAFIFYQQVMYGQFSPVKSGNFGFLLRNLSLAGALLLLVAQQRVRDGRTALPGLPDPGDKATMFSYIQLAARVLLVLLSLEFIPSLGVFGTLLAVPVVLLVLVGLFMPWSGLLLLFIYLLHNVLNSAFWSVDASTFTMQYHREVLKYEFVQTLSIMGGLIMLITSGPGALSVDDRMRRKNF